jgi:ABC-2 type transport system permease protein
MKLFAIFKKDLTIFLRNRADVAIEILMPLAFIIPISLALGSGDGYGVNRNNSMISLPVINYDQGPHAQVLMTGIGKSLKLEYGYDAQSVQSAGLQNDPRCQQAGASARALNATATAESQVTPAPGSSPTAPALPSATPVKGTPGGNATQTPTAPGLKATPGPTPLPEGMLLSARIAAEQNIAQCNEAVARAMLQRARRTAVLIIPEHFSADIDAGKPAQVSLLYDPGGDSIRFQQIEGVVKGAVVELSLTNQISNGLNELNSLVVLAPESVRSAVQQQVAAPAAAQPTSHPTNPALSLEKVFPDDYQLKQTPDTYQQTIPGYTVIFVFFIAAAMGSSLRQERQNGTLRRLLSAPISRSDLLGGKMLATVATGLGQVLILFGVGALLFKLNLGDDPLAFILLCLALSCAAAAIGLAAATTRLRDAALIAILVISALLGGCMFPLDLMPPFMRTLSLFVPHSWALTGFQNLMVRGQGLQQVFPQIVVLLVFAAVFFAVAARRFTFESQEGT